MPAQDIRQLLLQVDASVALAQRNLQSLAASVDRDSSKMDRALARVDGATNRLGAAMAGLRNVAGTLGIAIGAATFIRAGQNALDYAASLTEASRAIGLTVEQYQIMTRAAMVNGASQEGMTRSVAILNRTLGQARAGVTAAKQAFSAIGITPEQLRSLRSAGDALPLVMDGIRRLRTESEQAAAAQRLMGRGASEMIPLLVQGAAGYDGVAEAARAAGLITAEQAARADEAKDAIDALTLSMRTWSGIMLTDLIPEMQQIGAGLGLMFNPMATGAERATERVSTAMDSLIRDLGGDLHAFQTMLNQFGDVGDWLLHRFDDAARAMRTGVAGALPGGFPVWDRYLPSAAPVTPRSGSRFTFADRFERGAQDRALDQALDRIEGRGGYSAGGGAFLSYTPRHGSSATSGDTGSLDLDLSDSRGSARHSERTNQQAFRDFLAELARSGIHQNRGEGTGYRTQAQQDAYRRRGLTDARFSRHQTWEGLDIPLGASDEHIRRAAAAAGIRGLEIIPEPGARGGPHKHLEWSGHGRRGDIEGALADQEREDRDRERFRQALSQAEERLLRSRMEMVTSGDAQADFAVQQVRMEEARIKAGYEEDLRQGRIDEARAAQLILLNAQNADQEAANVRLRRAQQVSQEHLDLQLAGIADQRQLLQGQAQLAETRGQRLAIELRLVDLAEREERLQLQKILAWQSGARPEEVARAVIQYQSIGRRYGAQREATLRENEGPWARHMRELRSGLADVDTQLEELGVRSMNALDDATRDTIKSVLGLHGAFGDIIADLAMIYLRRAALAGADALFGGGSGGFSGFLRTILGAVSASSGAYTGELLPGSSSILPGFAGGGLLDVGGRPGTDRNILSINGVPRARVSASEKIAVIPRPPTVVIPRREAWAGGAPQKIVISIGLDNDMLNARIVEGSAAVVVQMEPGLTRKAVGETVRMARRPAIA